MSYLQGSEGSQASQEQQLDSYDKAEISVRSKAPELIGRMTVSLWIYCNGKIDFLHFDIFIQYILS